MKHPVWATLIVMFHRVRNYVGVAQFLMVAYLFIVQTEWNLITTAILLVLVFGGLAVFDFRWIMPSELGRSSSKNPVLMETLKRVKKIEEMLDGKT